MNTYLKRIALPPLLFFTTVAFAQNAPNKVVVVTGLRFAYPLVQRWIDDYNKVKPEVQIIIESRGTNDPAKYDILVEGHEHDADQKKKREYLYVARYAILPVANSRSAFAKLYGEKGLNQNLIKQIYFHDLYADKDKDQTIKAPYTVYTRLQKAGVPIVFTNYFGYEQKDIKGKAIAGSDEHLLKALLRDSLAVTYLPVPLAYDLASGNAQAGVTILPVDLNDNGKVSDEEKFYATLGSVIPRLESKDAKDLENLPISYLHFSVDKSNADPQAVAFIEWVIENGQAALHDFGYLIPEASKTEKEEFQRFASKRK